MPWGEYLKHSRRSRKAGDYEICGLVAVADRRITLLFLTNESSIPGSYLVNIAQARRAQRIAKHSGLRVIGSFHSHPLTEATPGQSDLANGFFWELN